MKGHHPWSRRSKRYNREIGGPVSRSPSCDFRLPVGRALTASAHPAIRPCRRDGKIGSGGEILSSLCWKAMRPLYLKCEPAARHPNVDAIQLLRSKEDRIHELFLLLSDGVA